MSDWSSVVFSSELGIGREAGQRQPGLAGRDPHPQFHCASKQFRNGGTADGGKAHVFRPVEPWVQQPHRIGMEIYGDHPPERGAGGRQRKRGVQPVVRGGRSEEHTSELQSLMRISYAVLCLKKKKTQTKRTQ